MKIELEKSEELLITYEGSIRLLKVSVDKYDDICFETVNKNEP